MRGRLAASAASSAGDVRALHGSEAVASSTLRFHANALRDSDTFQFFLKWPMINEDTLK